MSGGSSPSSTACTLAFPAVEGKRFICYLGCFSGDDPPMQVTGPVSQAMRSALLETWEAIPAPRLAIAAGACACSGGVFQGSPVQSNGLPGVPEIPVDLWIPGCPPHPITVLDGILRLLGRVSGDQLTLESTGIVEPAGER